MSYSNLGRAWEQGIVGGPDRLVLLASLARCGTNSHPEVSFRSQARVLPIHINSLARMPGNETGMEFNLTGTMEYDGRPHFVEGWYNVETGKGHLLIRMIFKK